MAVVTAASVESRLRDWQAGRITAAQMHEWAENTYAVSFWEPESDAVNEVLAQLDTLDMNLVTPDDIPVLIAALRSDDFEGLIADHFATVDFRTRRTQLAGVSPYAPFCTPS